MKVEIDREGCIGCGLCTSIASEIFRLGDNGLAEAVAQPDLAQEAEAAEAADSCPVNAIRTEE